MTLEGQAKLLRILEGHPFLPVGAQKEVSVDVRVIAATNQDLQTYVRAAQVSRRPVLSPERVRAVGAAAARARRRHRHCWSISSSITSAASTAGPGCKLSEAAREKLLAYHGPATCGSCAT